MKTITLASLAAATVVSIAACEAPGGSVAAAMAKMEEFEAAICKCTDAPCVEAVSEDMTRWSQEFARTADKNVRIDEATTRRMTEVSTRMTACAEKARTRPGPAEREPPAAVPAEAYELPVECAGLKAGIEKVATCDWVPQADRDALRASFVQLSASSAYASTMSAEEKAALGSSCTLATAALKVLASACN